MTRPPCHDCDENRDHCGQCGCCGDPSKLMPAAQPSGDVYRAAGYAMAPHVGDEERLFEWHECPDCEGPCSCAGIPYPSPAVRAAIDLAVERGREAAAQALRERADQIEVEPSRFGPRATLRRHLRMAARIAAGQPSAAELVTLLNETARGSGGAIVCRTADIEPVTDDGNADG